MLEESLKPSHDAMDKSFRYAGDQWSEDFHLNLELPGIFKSLLQNDTVKDPKTGIRMDILELAELEEGIEILINIEHQSKILDQIKIRIIDGYKNHSKCKHKLPLLTVIVSPFQKEKHETEYRSTESDVLHPVFITIDNEEINKRLNILKNNIKNKEIPNHIVLNIAIISIFVLNNKYEILKELCWILTNSIGIEGKIRTDMIKILEEMIKYKLQDNQKQVKELLNMLDEEREIARRGIRIWYEEEFDQIEAKHQKEINEIKLELAENKAEIAGKEAEHQKELNEKEAEHQKELNKKNIELAEKEVEHQKELNAKDIEIARLKEIIKTNGTI